MEFTKNAPNVNTQPLPYSKPQLKVFGDVRDLTATGSAMGAEMTGSMSML